MRVFSDPGLPVLARMDHVETSTLDIDQITGIYMCVLCVVWGNGALAIIMTVQGGMGGTTDDELATGNEQWAQ